MATNIKMRDVAQRANVSIKTVSRVVNNEGEISNATRERVLATIDEMGYRPNLLARSLVTQRTRTIGLVIPDICNPFWGEVTRGVEDVARQQDFRIVISNTDMDVREEVRALDLLDAYSTDGVIIITVTRDEETIRRHAERHPIVVYNTLFEHLNVLHVTPSTYQGGRMATQHLISKGHRVIGMVTSGSSDPIKINRVRGYHDVLIENGVAFSRKRVEMVANGNLVNGYVATKKLLTEQPDITALFCYNDQLAIGALRACSELGRKVPRDCAIIGFDDIEYAAHTSPALTTIRLDKREIGRSAMRLLIGKIEHPNKDFPPVEIDAELIVRESS